MQKENAMVIFQPTGRRGEVPIGSTVMEASRMLGVGIEALCGGHQVCGKCKVLIETGRFDKYNVESERSSAGPWRKAEGEHISPDERAAGYRLACAARVQGNLVIYVPEESRPGKQVVSKDARPIDIDCDPAVKAYFVQLEEATLTDPTADLERILYALEQHHGITGLTIDLHALRSLQQCVREGKWRVTVSIWMDQEIIRIQPGDTREQLGLAIDIGTTTLAGYLCDLGTGAVVATASSMNPQIQFGEDVISRINYRMNNDEGLAHLHQAVIDGLNHLIDKAIAKANPADEAAIRREDIVDVTMCGNTLMHHLVLGLDPEYLGTVPFVPANYAGLNIKARELGLRVNPAARIYLLPNEAGFVGGDNIGVILVEAPQNSEDTVLIIDIGTNGELIIGNRERLICSTCSCATGPALEGAQIEYGMRAAPGAIERVRIASDSFDVDYKVVGRDAWRGLSSPAEIQTKGICGSGILDAIAELLRTGLIHPTGAFNADALSDRLRENPDTGMMEFVLAWAKETSIGRDVTISQTDVRQVQLAKAAIYTGCKLMLQRMGFERPDRIKIAGAFGNHVDPLMALVIGMFPDCAIEKISSIGNAAGDGCRIALLNRQKRAEADAISQQVEYVELTLQKDFQEQLINAIHLPHISDAFPHLAGILPDEYLNCSNSRSRAGTG
jgi:uncharacterized 2Fe-2S/4Fe-4S cluster protein (DUF4445 family)